MFGVKVSYVDGTFAYVAVGISGLGEATRYALELADAAGSGRKPDGAEAEFVTVEYDEQAELVIRIIPGGLLGS